MKRLGTAHTRHIWFILLLMLLTAFLCLAAAQANAEEDCDHEYWRYNNKFDQTGHWMACEQCGYEVKEEHFANCSAPSTCAVCAQNGVTISEVYHNYDYDHPEYNKESHWFTCTDCGDVQSDYHYSSCLDPQTCYYCGATLADGIEIKEMRHYKGEIKFDDSKHYMICPKCGEMVYEDTHYGTCQDDSQCYECGAKVSEGAKLSVSEHVVNAETLYNETQCWWICVVCGEECGGIYGSADGRNTHTADCSVPDVCIYCGHSTAEGIKISKTEHTEEVLPAKAATCTESGLTEGRKCSTCGETITQQQTVPALGHDWDEGVVTKEATETEAGVKTFTCKRCNETRTEEIPVVEPSTAPKYEITEASFDKDDLMVTGKVAHDSSTEELANKYARITFFMSDGTFVAFATVIDDDGSFEAMTSGDVIHVAIQVSNNTKVRPGDYDAFGGYEFNVD